MNNKSAVPSLNLPRPKQHWTVGVVLGGGVLLLLLAVMFFVTVSRQRAAQEAAVRAAEAQAKALVAEAERLRLEALAKTEAEKKAVAAAAAAAQAQAKATAPSESGEGAAKDNPAPHAKKQARKGGHRSGKAGKYASLVKGNSGGAPSASTKKTDATVDALLKGLK